MAEYDSSSRYYNCDNANNIPQSNLTSYTYNYDLYVVSPAEENRLDLISYHVYNTPVNWWIIARFNSIINVNLVEAGTVIKIPKI